MEDRIYMCNLYDYYKDLLTDHQRACFEDYYFDNLNMSEIADNLSVSKNAISKTLKETISKLKFMESSLHLYNNKENIMKLLNEEEIKKIIDYI